jgi:hypothetical protein
MSEILRRFLELLKHMVQIVLDVLFLLGWLGLTAFVNKWIEPLVVGLAKVDVVVFGALQGIFAVSTILPIVIALYRDLAIMLKRANAEIGS